MRCQIIVELATNWAGDLALAKEMITVAAANGADWVKTQGFQVRHLSRRDPQYDWLSKCELSREAHIQLRDWALEQHVRYLVTVFHPSDIARVPGGVALKIGSGESGAAWWRETHIETRNVTFVSFPWGLGVAPGGTTGLATVPLYPAPRCAYAACRPQPGWSDHMVGLKVAKVAVATGATVVEKHFSLPGKGRNQPWDMTPTMLGELRAWTEMCAEIREGNAYADRWTVG